jgi:hypothetical protein
MKRLFLIFAVFSAVTCLGQTECNNDNALFNFNNAGTPKEIYTLGTNPEFPFLRNLSSPHQVYAAIKTNEGKNAKGMHALNEMLTAIGFANGAKDLDVSNITSYYVPVGTQGNMGSADHNTAYYKLSADASDLKAWKISSGTGCYVYILAKCGNAFFPKTEKKTACIVTPVSLSSEKNEVTLSSKGRKINSTANVYIYYHRKRHEENAARFPVAGIADDYPSTPLLINTTGNIEIVPETYKLTVSATDNTVKVFPDSILSLTANINVEKTSEYAGYYPDKSQKIYKEVSKREYKKSARKMRHAARKEDKVAKVTGIRVQKYACQ